MADIHGGSATNLLVTAPRSSPARADFRGHRDPRGRGCKNPGPAPVAYRRAISANFQVALVGGFIKEF